MARTLKNSKLNPSAGEHLGYEGNAARRKGMIDAALAAGDDGPYDFPEREASKRGVKSKGMKG